MAIVWAYFARAALRFVAIVPAVSWREWIEPHPLKRAILAKIVRSGVTVSVAGIATFLMRRWDNLLVQRFFGSATMGAYNYAYNLADTPAVAIGEQLSDVVAASFPHAQGERRKAALVRACTMTSLIMFPLAFGLGAVAQTVEDAFFDRKWAGIGAMLTLLSIVSAPRPMAHILHAYYFAAQRMRVVLWTEWLSLGLIMGGIATIGRLDVLWACGAVGAAFVLRTLVLMWVVQKLDGIPLRRFLLPLVRPLLTCGLMVAVIRLVQPSLQDMAPVAQLAIEVALGAAVYLAGARLIFREAASEFLGMVRAAVSRRGRKAEAAAEG
jgi:lipopolysaccharide exporter